MILKTLKIISILTLSVGITSEVLVAQKAQCVQKEVLSPASGTNSNKDTSDVKNVAQNFINRFRETLDFAILFREYFANGSVSRLRKIGFLHGLNVSPDLAERLDDRLLERFYIAFMNFYYLKGVFDLGVKDKALIKSLAMEAKSSSLAFLSDEETGDSRLLTTRQEVEQFIDDLNKMSKLYKNSLPKNVFDSVAYREGLESISKATPGQVQILDGYEDMGISKDTKVYKYEQELFIFYFIAEEGNMRVLMLGMGN